MHTDMLSSKLCWTILFFIVCVPKSYAAVLPTGKTPEVALSILSSGLLNDTNSDGISLSITWSASEDNVGRNIIIYLGSPSSVKRTEIFSFHPENLSGTKNLTLPSGVSFLKDLPRELHELDDCYNYWVEMELRGKIEATSCLKIFPFWMQKSHSYINERPINKIVIPGQDVSSGFSLVSGMLSSWPQLLFGSRYFQIEVHHEEKNSTNQFYLQKESFKTKFSTYLDDMCQFLTQTEELIFLEIIILPYSVIFEDNYAYYDLQMDILNSCQQHILLKTSADRKTYGDLVTSGKRLIYILRLPAESRLFWEVPPAIDYSYTKANGLSNQINADLRRYREKGSLYQIYSGMSQSKDSEAPTNNMISELEADLSSLVNIVLVSEPFNIELMDLVFSENRRTEIRRKEKQINTSEIKKTISAGRTELGEGTGIRVWPTIRATPYDGIYRLVTINWDVDEILYDDLIAIFSDIPSSLANYDVNIHLPPPSPPTESDPTLTLEDAEKLYSESNSHTPLEYSGELSAPLFIARPTSPTGMILTDFQHARKGAEDIANGGCIGVWAAYIRNQTVVSARCIASHPTWMWDNRC